MGGGCVQMGGVCLRYKITRVAEGGGVFKI